MNLSKPSPQKRVIAISSSNGTPELNKRMAECIDEQYKEGYNLIRTQMQSTAYGDSAFINHAVLLVFQEAKL